MIKEILHDAIKKQKNVKGNYEQIYKTVEKLVEISYHARSNGLLSLDNKLEKMYNIQIDMKQIPYEYQFAEKELSNTDRMIVVMLLLTMQGLEPAIIENIAYNKYFANEYDGIEALDIYIVIMGVLLIQNGVSPKVLEELLVAAIPEHITKKYVQDRLAV